MVESAVLAVPKASRRRARARRLAGSSAYALLVLLVCAVAFFPIYWMIVTAIRPNRLNLNYPPGLWPTDVELTPFRRVFAEESIERWIANSTLLSAATTALCILLAVFGAYALSALRWRGRAVFAIFLLMTQMLPEALVVVPIFRLYNDVPLLHVNLRESLLGLSLVDAAFILPIGVWVLKNMFDTVPREVREAALVDGAGPIRVLFQIVLPITLPGLVAVGIVAFFYAWNEFLFAFIFTATRAKTAPLVISEMIGSIDGVDWGVLFAASTVQLIPVLVFVVLMNRYLVAGLSTGATKG